MTKRRPYTREEFQTPAGRQRAWRALALGDHGVLRLFYDNSHDVSALARTPIQSQKTLWRTYQPGPARLKKWRNRGINTVINLRGPNPSGPSMLEEEACAELGMAYIPFRVFSREAPSPETLHGARALFKKIQYPVLIHCKSGADRAGLMATLFLFFEGGLPLDQAMTQLSLRYGHIRQGKTGVIDYAFDQYIAYAANAGIALDDVAEFFKWVDTTYDPTATKAAFKANWWGTLLTDKLLRRE